MSEKKEAVKKVTVTCVKVGTWIHQGELVPEGATREVRPDQAEKLKEQGLVK